MCRIFISHCLKRILIGCVLEVTFYLCFQRLSRTVFFVEKHLDSVLYSTGYVTLLSGAFSLTNFCWVVRFFLARMKFLTLCWAAFFYGRFLTSLSMQYFAGRFFEVVSGSVLFFCLAEERFNALIFGGNFVQH